MAGARVIVEAFQRLRSGTQTETLSDAIGAYSLALDPRDANGSIALNVEKDGFEPSRVYAFFPSANQEGPLTRNVCLHEILRIRAGESVELRIAEDDSVCEASLDENYCRRVRVVSPMAGHLVIEVPFATWPEPYLAIRLLGPPNYDARLTFRIPVDAGSETVLDVLLYGRPPLTSTLTTRLEPS